MINFEYIEDTLLLNYSPENGSQWIKEGLWQDGDISIKKTFHFTPKDLADEDLIKIFLNKADDDTLSDFPSSNEDVFDDDAISFILGRLVDDYYEVPPSKVLFNHTLYIHKDVSLSREMFISSTRISIFRILERLVNDDIYLGGDAPNAIPEEAFHDLINKFPNPIFGNKYNDF